MTTIFLDARLRGAREPQDMLRAQELGFDVERSLDGDVLEGGVDFHVFY